MRERFKPIIQFFQIREFFVPIFQIQEIVPCRFFKISRKIFGNAGDAGENLENVGDLAEFFPAREKTLPCVDSYA